MIMYKIICEDDDCDQYIEAESFEIEGDGDLRLVDENYDPVAYFVKDFWKAIRIANDLIPNCKKCGAITEEHTTHYCENCDNEEMSED